MAESDFDANADLYEYDAPSQVVDLKELQNAESDDKWFGKSVFITVQLPAIVVLMMRVAAPVGPNDACNLSTAVV